MNILFRMPASRLVVGLGLLALILESAAAGDDPWQDDIQFASSQGGADTLDADATYDYCNCCSGGANPAAALKARMTAMRDSMAAQGIMYDIEATQFYQGVTDGGIEQNFEYGGKVDQFLILDSGKLGLWQGMTMTMHAETRFGQDVNFDAVGLAPVNVAMLYPAPDEHTTAITGLSFAQALDEETQVTFGKFNGLDLFYMLYPQTGRGVNGFMNASMVIPITVARVVPLSFMGAGALKLHGKQVQGGVLVYDTQDVATTSGFDDMFNNGANIMGFWRFFTEVNGLPGSHYFGGIWSTGEFVAFDPAGFAIVPGEGIVAEPQGGAYTLLYALEQTLWADCCNKNRNISLLSVWGLADELTSPFHWSANVAIQAQGINRRRPNDTSGVGYFYTGLSSDFQNLLAPVVALQDVHGVELYYNAAITNNFHLTTDLQVIEPAEVANDTAVVFGLRGTLGM